MAQWLLGIVEGRWMPCEHHYATWRGATVQPALKASLFGHPSSGGLGLPNKWERWSRCRGWFKKAGGTRSIPYFRIVSRCWIPNIWIDGLKKGWPFLCFYPPWHIHSHSLHCSYLLRAADRALVGLPELFISLLWAILMTYMTIWYSYMTHMNDNRWSSWLVPVQYGSVSVFVSRWIQMWHWPVAT